METIINPIAKNILKAELTPQLFVRTTNNGSNHIYILNHHNAPNVMQEIARLREVTFRASGGGTGLALDIDENDTCAVPYQQLIVWNPIDEEIVGGYRYIKCKDAILEDGTINLSTAHLFNYSADFITNYFDTTIELGRSWIQPNYQPSSENRKGLFSLDNLWDGLGALVVDNEDVTHFFGKVTMYTHYNIEARDMLLAFMHYYFADNDKLVTPIHGVKHKFELSSFYHLFEGLNYKDGHKVLNQHIRALGENIPPLINSYMNLSATMKTFGTAVNDLFGDVEETGILVKIADIYDSKKERHVQSYIKQ
jgi:Acetyltransferase (GNAT) domain